MDTQEVVLEIFNFMHEKKMKAGERLPAIREFAELVGCTPSEIRTGIISLSSIGLVEIRPRAGTFVKSLDNNIIQTLFGIYLQQGMGGTNQNILHVYDLKTIIEPEVLALASQVRTDIELLELRAILIEQRKAVDTAKTAEFIILDEKFHSKIAKITRNPLVSIIQDLLHAMLRPDRLSNPNNTEERFLAIIEDHVQLYEAIRNRDEESARALARKHSNRRKSELVSFVYE
ncbi:MAG: FCD domain-containing protein [Sphaerochaeta sp.]|nr:FCD domain-containing protein [Sphaerochaeta sp.]